MSLTEYQRGAASLCIDEAGRRARPETLAGAMSQQAVVDRPDGTVPVARGATGCSGRAIAAAFALHPPRTGHGLDPRDPGRFAARLEAFRRHHAALPAPRLVGGLQLLDIEELRLRFGNRWPALREKAYQIVEGSLARRLGPHDLYVALEGDRFHLLVTDIDRLAAERRGRFIAAEITARLCGMVPGGVACRLRTTGFDLVAGLAGIAGPGALEARIEAFERQVDEAELALFTVSEPAIEALYQPVLNVRKRLVTGYALTPMLDAGAGRRGVQALCPSSLNGVFDAALDRWSIARAAQALPAGRTTVRIELHYATLAAMRHREKLMLACRRLPGGAARRLVIEITGLPASLPQARVRELVSYLRPFTVAVLVRLEPDLLAASVTVDGTSPKAPLPTDHLQTSGVAGISVVLRAARSPTEDATGPPDHVPTAAGTEEGPPAAAVLAGLAALGRAAGLRTSVVIDSGVDAARAAMGAGCHYLAGEALMPLTARPGRAIRLTG